jgi:hypothetical protein
LVIEIYIVLINSFMAFFQNINLETIFNGLNIFSAMILKSINDDSLIYDQK